MDEEILLSGGNTNVVVRIGETVHRRQGPWSPAVHHFLQYMEKQQFDGTPRFLGIDDLGREILTFFEGEVGNYPLKTSMWSEATLVESASFLRHYHDSTVDYIPLEDARWQYVHENGQQHEVICHNDFAPYNIVFRNNRVRAVIDFDMAGPGPRIRDVAYAAYRFIPLSYDLTLQALGLESPMVQYQRLEKFCRAYGLTSSYLEVLYAVIQRIEEMCTFILNKVALHDAVYEKVVRAGHLALYYHDIEMLQKNLPIFEQYFHTKKE